MKDKKSWTRRVGDFLAGKGFYVVLFICTAVIGVSAWILLFTGNKPGKADTDSIASAQVSQEVIAPTDNTDDTDAFSTDTMGQKPTVTPTQPSASVKPSASATPSAAPTSTKPNSNSSEGKAASAMAKQLTFTWPVVGDIAVMYSVDELIYNQRRWAIGGHMTASTSPV